MKQLSPHEIADLVIKAGFSKTTIVPNTKDTEAVVAVAVAIAESGLDSEQISRTTSNLTSDSASVGNRDHGLFQLSGRWQYDKVQAASGRWRDPVTNVAIAYKIFVGAGRTFTSWSVFAKNDKGVAPYEQSLPDARLAVAQPWPYVDEYTLALSKISTDVAKVAATMLELQTALKSVTTQVTEIRKHFS